MAQVIAQVMAQGLAEGHPIFNAPCLAPRFAYVRQALGKHILTFQEI